MRLRIMPAGYLLLAGDLVAFLLFAYYGKLAHHLPVTILGLLETLVPFMIGWAVAVFLFGSYRLRAYETWWRLLLSTLMTWTVAAPIGLVIRSLLTDTPITLLFASVAYFITLAFLLGWRIPFAIVYALRSRSSRAGV
jgi:hypothetical protein